MNMTSDPNQQNRPNVFGEDFNYPSPNEEWNRFNSPNYYMQTNFPFCSNFGSAPVTFPISPDKNPSINVHYPNIIFNSIGACKMNQRSKRKIDSPPPMSAKQHITEEKMAEHLAKLHISSETGPCNEMEDIRTKRLYMCEEMRKLQTESILPATLLNKVQRPCTALVLWQPPQRLVTNENDCIDNNNEEEVPDNNLMET